MRESILNLEWLLGSRDLGGCSSAGRAPDLHSGGRRFDPDQLHQWEAAAKHWTPKTGCFDLSIRKLRRSRADGWQSEVINR